MSNPHIVADGAWVVLLLSGGEQKLQRVRSGTRLRIGKHNALYDPIIGAPFGASFVLETGEKEARLVRDPRTLEQIDASLTDAAAALGGASADANNAELRDDGAASTAQGLDQDAILRLKSEGTSGEALVLAIAAGSKTFAGKTAFSQEKYLRKKARKHLLHATILKVRGDAAERGATGTGMSAKAAGHLYSYSSTSTLYLGTCGHRLCPVPVLRVRPPLSCCAWELF